MKIAYVAKHFSGGNDDEGAIAFALRQLGHDVTLFAEDGSRQVILEADVDFVLYHKWNDFDCISELKVPSAFWYFDLVEYPQDPSLGTRDDQRRKWMSFTMGHSIGFCTDGDWAAKHSLQVLRQGADERFIGIRESAIHFKYFLPCNVNGGSCRRSFVDYVLARIPGVHHVQKDLHQEQLAETVSKSSVVLAPDSPSTDDYWSNRVYLILGFGGVLLHPFCRTLADDLRHLDSITYYGSRKDMEAKARYLSSLSVEDRMRMKLKAISEIRDRHLYRHRCQRLVEIVSAKIGYNPSDPR